MANEPKLNTRLDNNKDSSLYDHVGGKVVCRRLSERFHDRILHDPVLKAMFPKDPERLTEHFALFIAERLGGPMEYTQKRGKQSLVCRHAHLPLGAAEAERWLGHMFATLEEVEVTEPARQRLQDYFIATARTLSDPFLPLYNLPLDELQQYLEANPALATSSHHGRSLLRNAAHNWDRPRVQLLLKYQADVNVRDPLGHDPLYHTVTSLISGAEAEGSAVIALLIRHGANVNGQSGPGQSTPLHMAARRGNVAIARCLLEAGAEIETKDSKGETPLRRAVNCGQIGVVHLLLSRGADPMSQDKKGRTVLDAARQDPIREALQRATISVS